MDGMYMLRKDVGKFKGKFMKLCWNMKTLKMDVVVVVMLVVG